MLKLLLKLSRYSNVKPFKLNLIKMLISCFLPHKYEFLAYLFSETRCLSLLFHKKERKKVRDNLHLIKNSKLTKMLVKSICRLRK